MDRQTKEQMFCNIADKARRGGIESLTYFKEVELLKGTKNNRNPYLGRVTKAVKVTAIQFGVEYCNIGGVKGGNGKGNGLIGSEWVSYPVIIRSLSKDASKYGKLQLRCTLTGATKFATTYFVDGRLATDNEVAEIKQALPKQSMPLVFNITIENVAEWKVDGQYFCDSDLLGKINTYKVAM